MIFSSSDHGRREHEAEAGAEPAGAPEGDGGGGTGARTAVVQARASENLAFLITYFHQKVDDFDQKLHDYYKN